MSNFYQTFFTKDTQKMLPNSWDAIAIVLVLSIITLFAWGAKQISGPYHIGQTFPISLSPSHLPAYATLTVFRMLIAMAFSVLFTFTIGTWAAKSRRAGQLLIPAIDILQSVPVLGYLSLTITGFIALFPGSRLGPECAAIFTIFVAQVWNMTLSFYQSLRTIPPDLKEAADMFHLSSWQRFWKIEVPFAMPGLLWNAMLSMSGSWIFLIASEAISVNNQQISLPGVGSYLGLAIEQANLHAVGNAILTMAIVIFFYDQLLFRPLLHWAEKFKAEQESYDSTTQSFLVNLLKKTRVLKLLGHIFAWLSNTSLRFKFLQKSFFPTFSFPEKKWIVALTNITWYLGLFLGMTLALFFITRYFLAHFTHAELWKVFCFACFTALRIVVIVIISTVVWVPLGVWIGLRKNMAELVQPLAQFLAAFPMNVLFPLFVVGIMTFHLDVNIWTTPLMLLGTQWYILFNVIAGTMALPKELIQVANNFGITGWQWWKRLILPGIFPFYITGAMTAVGNAWNTSIVAEVIRWGNTTLVAKGLGAYITQSSTEGDFARVALGMSMMCIFVLICNRLLWQPLYFIAQKKYTLN